MVYYLSVWASPERNIEEKMKERLMKWLFSEKLFPSWKETKTHFKDDWGYYAAFIWLGLWLGILGFPIWTWQYWAIIIPMLLFVQIHVASKCKKSAAHAVDSVFRIIGKDKPEYDEPTPIFGNKP